MVEAPNTLAEAKIRARMSMASYVLARQAAIKATKAKFQAQGLKPMYMSRREIITAAEVYLDNHRAELIAEAKPIVERWRLEGFFGKRAALSSDAQGGNG